MISISKRPCQLGITINTRRELHKLKCVTLQPMSGGVTLLSFKVQSSVDDMGDVVSNLVAHLDRTIEIAVSGGEAKPQDTRQADLPINTFGDGETVLEFEGRDKVTSKRKRRSKNGHATAH